MWMLFDFECSACGHKFEKMVTPSVTGTGCPKCSRFSQRLIATPHIDYRNMGLDPIGNPTSGAKWARWHEREAQKDPI